MKTNSVSFAAKALGQLSRLWKSRQQAASRKARRRAFLVENLEPRAMMAADVLTSLTSTGSNLYGPYSEVGSNSAGTNTYSTSAMPEGESGQDLVAFAKALAASGAKLYGADWNADTTTQRNTFEDGWRFLPFVEVTNADHTANSVATTNNITTYPTWVFANSTRLTGPQTLSAISAASGIAIPTNSNPTFSTLFDPTGSATVGNVNVLSGSPLWVALDGYNPGGGPLTYSVSVSNATGGLNLQASVPTGNKTLTLNVAGFGTMKFQLFDDMVPRVTSAIESLVNGGFYNGLTFHRILTGFVLQGGSSSGDGLPDPNVADFDDQFNFDLNHNQAGILSMAKGADDTNDTQFFITNAATRYLDYNHSIFGMLVEGDDVRQAISRVPVSSNGNGTPLSPVIITSATITDDTENKLLLLKPLNGTTGAADVTVTVHDGSGNTFSRTYHVTATADTVNDNPFLSDLASNTLNTSSGAPVNMQLQGNDADGTTNNFYFDVQTVNSADASKFTINVNRDTGSVTITPNAGVVGTFKLAASVRDKSATTNPTDSQVFSVVVKPSAPAAPVLAAASDTGTSSTDGITKLSNVTFTVSNVNIGSVVKLYAGDTVIATTTATGTTATLTVPNLAALGEVSTNFSATQTNGTDESARSAVTVVTYDVTAPGNITSSPGLSARAGQTYTYDAASPNEGQSGVIYALVNPPAGATINAATGVVSWNPTAAQVGTADLSVVVRDAAGNESSTQTFTVTVLPAIEAKIDFKLKITDLNGNAVSTLNVGDSFYLIGTVKDLRTSGQGVYSFYTDITFDSTLAEVNGSIIYGAAFGSAPSGSTSTPGLIDEVGSFSSSLSGPGTTTVEAFRIPMKVLHAGQIRFNSNGPDVHPAHDNLLFNAGTTTVSDDEVQYGTAAVSVGLTYATNNDTFSVNEDTTNNTLNVLANDTINPGSGNVLTIDSVTSAGHGTVTIATDGKSLLYTPSANYFGSDTFTYTVRNQNGDLSTANVTVNVQNVNDMPTASSDAVTVAEDSGNTIVNVLANDTSSPDTGETLSVIGVTQGTQGGIVTIGANGQNIIYRPAANKNGTETFTYTISDGNGGTSSAIVTVTITPQNDNPTVVNDTATVTEDSTANHVNVMGNDSSSPDTGETLVVTAVTQGNKGGTVAIGANGVDVLYTPAANFYGTETFTYTISDGNGGTATGTVTMTVTNTNDPPTANTDTLQAYKNTEVTLDVLANDSSLPDPAETFTITAVTQPAHGTVTIAADGKTVKYLATTGYTGADSFTYTMRDPGGLTSTATVNLTVLEFIPSTLSGYSYIDSNNNGVKDSGELPLAGITITLTGTDANNATISKTAVTAADGSYSFANLAPGAYSLGKVQPVFMVDGKETVGSQGGTTANNKIQINLSQETTGTGNNFGEASRQSSNYRKQDFFASTWRSQVVVALPVVTGSTSTNTSAIWQSVTGAGWNQLTNVTFTVVNSGTQLKINANNASSQPITTTISLNDPKKVLDLGTQNQQRLIRLVGPFSSFGFTVVPTTSNSLVPEGESTSNLVYGNNNSVNDAALLSTLAEGESTSQYDSLVTPSSTDQSVVDSALAGTDNWMGL
ncbi:MAG: Ig-like domain-containing protein [Planctomycetaceae bacterium]